MIRRLFGSKCDTCPASGRQESQRLGLDTDGYERVLALAGNPNTGKSTVFNALTGLRQHTGNWPGKTVSRAEGGFAYNGVRYKLVDLPGTYSLLSASTDEEVARDFILFGRPDCTIVVLDATCLQRNLNLALQVLEITPKVVICVNLMDEARRKGIEVNTEQLSKDLGVPVVGTAARRGEGLEELLAAIDGIVSGAVKPNPYVVPTPDRLKAAIDELVPMIEQQAPGVPNARWIAYRLLEGDHSVREAVRNGTLAQLVSLARSTGREGAIASLEVVGGAQA